MQCKYSNTSRGLSAYCVVLGKKKQKLCKNSETHTCNMFGILFFEPGMLLTYFIVFNIREDCVTLVCLLK